MKKTNFVTLISFIALILAAILFMCFWKTPSESKNANASEPSYQTDPSQKTEMFSIGSIENSTSSPIASRSEGAVASQSTAISMTDALFIGDSRTVGLSEYSGIDGADFFANVGMSVYNIYKQKVSVPTVGKVTLEELLYNKRYGKIYIMLGVNEIGYNTEQTIAKYKELVELIQQTQPNAVIFIQANLHVTKSRSDNDKIVNNQAINRLNKAISEIADSHKTIYLDANVLFDDGNGNLSADRSEDNTHLYARYYKQWGEWILAQTALIIGEDSH